MDAQSVSSLLTAKIVGSYLRHHTVGTSELSDLIATVNEETDYPSPMRCTHFGSTKTRRPRSRVAPSQAEPVPTPTADA
jgi:predicted transcriptional regulator